MAGDWIKMRTDLPTSPKVIRISSALKADRFRIVGGLHCVWSLFDAHSEDGVLEGYTEDVLDDLIGWPGFSSALVSVGWLDNEGGNLALPRFETHNGKSAKRRCMDKDRKKEERLSASDADERPKNVCPREEKRREEKREDQKQSTDVDLSPAVADSDAKPPRKSVPACPHMEIIGLYHEILPELPEVRVWEADRQGYLRQRWLSHPDRQNLEWWRDYFTSVRSMPWLMGQENGRDGRPFVCNLEWLVRQKNFAKVIEGFYLKGWR